MCDYVDDLPTVSVEELVENTTATVSDVMELLGWTMSEKTPDFAPEFDALGVRVNLEAVGE
eukprot:3826999-Amphidinium_carterae.1